MSTAVVKIDKGLSRNTIPAAQSVRLKRFTAQKAAARSFSWTNFLLLTSAFLVILFAALAASFFYFYTSALATVDQRIKLGFWQTRSGIYAAPRVLRKGQKTSVQELVANLRHAGYVEGESRDIWSGNFSVNGDTISIQTNETAREQTETISLKIANNEIQKIQSGSRALDAYELQPEMISGSSEAKRGSVNTLKFEQIPETLRNAIIATEDRRFFEHSGLDFRGTARALWRNISDNSLTQGGSTITQQFVKNVFLTREKTFARKFNEAFLALALEKRLSKEEIFALYCNEIYLGQYGAIAVHGVEQASRVYFGKAIEKLSVAEAATLAAMIKSPNRYAPHKDYATTIERRNLVLQMMAESNLISPLVAQNAAAEQIALAAPKKNDQSLAPYFVDSAAKQIAEKNLPEGRNLRVYTTIDTELQELAENAVKNNLAKLDKTFAKKGLTPQAALVALDPHSGKILAMVGGRDYAASQLNRASEARRQPGSTFKPFVYAAALERGKLPTTLISDRPTAFPFDRKPYQPANYGDSYAMRDITLKTALAKSSNVAAVETALSAGLNNVTKTAEKFGLPKPPEYPSIALGTAETTPLELAAAYAAFANGGKRIVPTYVSKIVSGDGEILTETEPRDASIISPQTAYMITDMLGAAVERGTARAAHGALGKDAVFVGKTGSSKDGWFVGYTPNLVTVVWIGFDEGDKDIGFTGGEIALPVWVDFMRDAVRSRPEFGGKAFPMPKGLLEIAIDPETGMLADKFCPAKEKVVILSNAFSNIACWRHQPKMETMYAEFSPEEYELNAPATVSYETEETPVSVAAEEKFKSVNGVPVRIGEDKEEKKSPETTKTNKNSEHDLDAHLREMSKPKRIGGIEN
jgi:penicillin-binding protein 1B